jgi:hypothetical protein
VIATKKLPRRIRVLTGQLEAYSFAGYAKRLSSLVPHFAPNRNRKVSGSLFDLRRGGKTPARRLYEAAAVGSGKAAKRMAHAQAEGTSPGGVHTEKFLGSPNVYGEAGWSMRLSGLVA